MDGTNAGSHTSRLLAGSALGEFFGSLGNLSELLPSMSARSPAAAMPLHDNSPWAALLHGPSSSWALETLAATLILSARKVVTVS